MKKIITSFFILIALSVQAQDNQIKLNLFALALGNVSLQYEHTLKEHSSICLGVSILPSRYLPTVITDKDSSGALKLLSFSGFSFTPEYRYYFSGNAPKGFYIAPYLRYSKYGVDKLGVEYHSNTTNKDERVYVDGTLKSTTVGLMFGTQWKLGAHMTLDWWIVGFGFGSQSATLTGVGNFTQSDIEDIKVQIADLDSNIPGTLTSDVTSTSVSVKYEIGSVAFRASGLCLGYRF